ncbi:MAG: phosphotransferase [Clostridia bacterium]|nr:phosphotransferase [Clostridia bacterium]
MTFDKELFDSIAESALDRYNWESEAYVKLIVLSENATYMVKSRDNDENLGVLRVSRPGYHTLSELESEMSWLRQINDYTPLIVANPINGSDGKPVQQVEGHDGHIYFCVICDFLKGSEPDESNPDKIVRDFEMLGETNAYLHRQASIWNGTKSIDRIEWTYDNIIGKTPQWGRWQDFDDMTPEAEEFLEAACDIIQKRLERYGRNQNNWGLIHADLRLANILIDGDVIKVIDFDDCGMGWHLHDLASSISFIEHKDIVPDLINAWLRGYKKVMPLSDTDFEEIDTFILMRRLQLMAWLASHKDSGPVAELSVGYFRGTIELAERYIRLFG